MTLFAEVVARIGQVASVHGVSSAVQLARQRGDTVDKYTARDQGCYADGTHGHEHIRLCLADLLMAAGAPRDYADALELEMSDDASEEDEALEWLNANTCVGVMFGLADGDLLLLTAESWNERV